MKQTILVLTIITLLITPGCASTDRLTDTLYLLMADVTHIKSQTIDSHNVTTSGLVADNATLSTLILKNLPTADPGISGAVWSDNGTLRISP
jgi:hypothetical protein